MIDVVEQLRAGRLDPPFSSYDALHNAAAAEIERLRAEVVSQRFAAASMRVACEVAGDRMAAVKVDAARWRYVRDRADMPGDVIGRVSIRLFHNLTDSFTEAVDRQIQLQG